MKNLSVGVLGGKHLEHAVPVRAEHAVREHATREPSVRTNDEGEFSFAKRMKNLSLGVLGALGGKHLEPAVPVRADHAVRHHATREPSVRTNDEGEFPSRSE